MWANWFVDQRQMGLVRCCITSVNGLALADVVRTMGLSGDADLLTCVDIGEARVVLRRLLTISLVDKMQAMDSADADLGLESFFKDFDEKFKFYTNGDWANKDLTGWNSMTESVFDGGLIAFGDMAAACVWIEEDA